MDFQTHIGQIRRMLNRLVRSAESIDGPDQIGRLRECVRGMRRLLRPMRDTAAVLSGLRDALPENCSEARNMLTHVLADLHTLRRTTVKRIRRLNRPDHDS